MKSVDKFGDFEIVSKKSCIGLRRKEQIAMVGPATNTRAEAGFNIKRPQADLPSGTAVIRAGEPVQNPHYRCQTG